MADAFEMGRLYREVVDLYLGFLASIESCWTTNIGRIRGYAAPQFSEGESLDQHGPNQVEDAHTTNVKNLRWLSPHGNTGHNDIKIIQ